MSSWPILTPKRRRPSPAGNGRGASRPRRDSACYTASPGGARCPLGGGYPIGGSRSLPDRQPPLDLLERHRPRGLPLRLHLVVARLDLLECRDGSVVVVDQDDRPLVRRDLCVMRVDGGGTVKYVLKDGADLVLIPENREHRENRATIREGEPDPVVGRVIWSWGVGT